jgi:hypothetical protein
MKIQAIAVCAIATALAAQSQTIAPTIDSPLLGMVLDRNAARLRPVYGVPGAATVGVAIDTGEEISSAAASPTGRFAVVVSGADSHASLLLLDGPSQTPFSGVPGGVSAAALSPQGSTAGFYYESERVIRTIAGMPSNNGALRSFSLAALPGANPLWAVSDDGQFVLYSGGTSEVFILGGETGLRRLATNGVPAALGFMAGSREAIVATPDGTAIVRNIAVRPEMRGISLAKAPAAPAFLGFSADGTQGFLMGRVAGHATMARFSSDGTPDRGADAADASAFDCQCTDFSPQRTAAPSVYILSNYTGKPLPALDAGATPARIFFVPPAMDSARLP